MRVRMRCAATTVILLVISWAATAQNSSSPDTSVRKSTRVSLAITAGFAAPLSKDALTQFWKGGPGGAVSILVRPSPGFWIGAGVDVSALWFRKSVFGRAYPTVEIHSKNMAWVNVFVLSRYGFIPGGSVHPYAEVAVGASRFSGAEYKEVIDSVRVTYYDIPARTRLALTLTGGVDIPVSNSFSFLAEAALRYVHNDENVGLGLLIRGGVRVTL